MDSSSPADGAMPSDMGNVDAAFLRAEVLASLPALPIASVVIAGGGTALPDYSCRQAWDQEAAGGGTVTGRFNFDYGGPIGASFDVKIYPTNDIASDTICTGSCFTRPMNTAGGTTDFTLDTGRFTAWATPAWTAAWSDHVGAASGYFYMSDSFVSDGVRESPPSDTELAGAYARGPVAFTSGSSATMFGTLRDCMGRSVQGAAIRVFAETGLRQELEPPITRYENVWVETAEDRWTNNRGEFLSLDMRPATLSGSLMRIEAWANLGSATPELVACEKIRIIAGNYTTLRFLPIRSASPSDCTP